MIGKPKGIIDLFFVTRGQWISMYLLMCWLSIMALTESYNLYLDTAFSKLAIEEKFETLTKRYGIRIVYQIGDDFLSNITHPFIAVGPPKDSKIMAIRHRVLLRYPQRLSMAFKKYPEEVIKGYLNAIHFAAYINHNGVSSGGTYDTFRRIVYMVDGGGRKDNDAISTFHHEFSSLLLSRHSFFLNPWFDQNPKDFVYAYESEKNWLEVFNNSSLEGTEADYEKGFMNTYGQTEFENDFNEYSAMIFTYPEKFKRIMARYPRVRGKFLVWLKFYQEIDPIFTEEYLLGVETQGG